MSRRVVFGIAFLNFWVFGLFFKIFEYSPKPQEMREPVPVYVGNAYIEIFDQFVAAPEGWVMLALGIVIVVVHCGIAWLMAAILTWAIASLFPGRFVGSTWASSEAQTRDAT